MKQFCDSNTLIGKLTQFRADHTRSHVDSSIAINFRKQTIVRVHGDHELMSHRRGVWMREQRSRQLNRRFDRFIFGAQQSGFVVGRAVEQSRWLGCNRAVAAVPGASQSDETVAFNSEFLESHIVLVRLYRGRKFRDRFDSFDQPGASVVIILSRFEHIFGQIHQGADNVDEHGAEFFFVGQKRQIILDRFRHEMNLNGIGDFRRLSGVILEPPSGLDQVSLCQRQIHL